MSSQGVKNSRFYLVKRRLRGGRGEGVKNCRFWDDRVYGQPLISNVFLYLGLEGIVTDTMCPKYRKKGFWEPPNGLCWTVFAQQHHGLCCGLPLKSWVALRPYINRQACMKVTLYDLWLSFWAFEGKVYDRNWITVDCMKSNSNSLAKRFQKFPKVNKQINKFFSKLSSRHLTKV